MPKLEGKGGIPKDCPQCNAKDVVWDWGDTENYDQQNTQEVTCPECNTEFLEIEEVVSWEKKE